MHEKDGACDGYEQDERGERKADVLPHEESIPAIHDVMVALRIALDFLVGVSSEWQVRF